MRSNTQAAREMTMQVPTETEVRTLRNYVGGAWIEPSAERTIEDRDPASGERAALVPLSAEADVDAAVRAAREAQPRWREVPPQERAHAVFDLRAALIEHRRELAALITSDMGKTLAEADAEVGRGIESAESAAAIPHLLKGESLEGVAPGVDVQLVREPVGVVAAITPFNFPAMIPLWFMPYAIACGNGLVLKPSERDPRPAERIVELIDSIERIPPGVVNLVHGAREAVEAILAHPGIDAVSFVGQATTARIVAEGAARTGKRAQALGGAKNALVVMPDAELDRTVPVVMSSAFGAAGQRCLAGSVAVIVGDQTRQNEVRDALAAAAAELAIGAGASPETEVCPMVAPEARQRAEGAIARAVEDGARLVLDGRMGGGESGAFLGPTIVDALDAESELAREEVFGPILALVRVPDLDAALSFANGSRYGNAGAIFTSSGRAARAYSHGIEAGMIGVNIGVPAPVAWFPFAGWKDSCLGDLHANGSDAVDFYTRKKVVTARW